MTIAYSYIRFSSKKQAAGSSLRRQTEAAEKWAISHSIPLDTTLHMQDLAVSAFKGTHIEQGALGKFIKAIETGVVKDGSYLLVESLDRLSREDVPTALQMFLNIINSGITIVTLSDDNCQHYSASLFSRECLINGVHVPWHITHHSGTMSGCQILPEIASTPFS